MSVPTSLDITRVRGDTHAMQFTIKDSAGAAVNVTGFSFLLTVDPAPDPSDALNNLFQLTATLVDAVNGVIEFAPTAMEADQTPNTYFYDLQMTDAGSAIRTIAKGKFIFTPDITK